VNESEFQSSYAKLDEALKNTGLEIGGAEAHGTLCGLLAADCKEAEHHWIRHLFSDLGDRKSVKQETLGLLSRLHGETATQLNDPEYAFYLFLPPADRNLANRIEALAGWCQGFLYGLGVSLAGVAMDFSSDVREVVSDLNRIATVHCGVGLDDEATALDFEELSEYVRVAALLVREDFRSVNASTRLH